MDYKQKYQLWLDRVKDEQILSELKAMNDRQIQEAFSSDLSFGTAGLRGVMSAGTHRMNVYTVYKTSVGVARYMLEHDMKKCAVTYDSRLNSQRFAETVAATLAQMGIAVVITKEGMPTPFLSYMVRELKCDMGVNITASHNPSEYNGYKVYDSKGCQLLEKVANKVTALIDEVDLFAEDLPSFSDFVGTMITYVEDKLEEKYVKTVLSEGVGKIEGLNVVYTPLCGVGHRIVPKTLVKAGLENLYVVPEQATPNGKFETCPYPNPEKAEALTLALELAKQKSADIVIANDPDCDRLGVAVKKGDAFQQLSGNEVGILLTDYVLMSVAEGGKVPADSVVVKTVVSSAMTDAVVESYGAKTRDVLTGFKYIGDVIAQLERRGKKRSFVFGFEESCGYLKGTYVRDKDGVIAALLTAQCASFYKKKGLTLIDRLEQLYAQFGYYFENTLSYRFEGIEGATRKNELLNKLRENPFDNLGGSAVVDVCDFLTQDKYDLPLSDVLRFRSDDGCQLIVRPSGTEPLIKCYVTAKGDKANAEKKYLAIKAQIDATFGGGEKKSKKEKPEKPLKSERAPKAEKAEKASKCEKTRMFTTLNTVTTAMLCAVAVILATTLHAFMETGIANLLAPMHFPILLVGILCGPIYGLIGGIVTPLISALTNASFTYTRAVPMMVELATYGLMTGLLRNAFLKNPKTHKFYATIVLVIAMVVGRALHAVVKTFIVASEAAFFPTLWANFLNDFTSTWGGIIAQLVLIPAILYALLRGGILIKYIPDLEPKTPTKRA